MLTQRIEIQLRCVFMANTKHWMNFTLEKKISKCRWKEVIYITQIYATSWPGTQIQGFKKHGCGSSSGNKQQAQLSVSLYSVTLICRERDL